MLLVLWIATALAHLVCSSNGAQVQSPGRRVLRASAGNRVIVTDEKLGCIFPVLSFRSSLHADDACDVVHACQDEFTTSDASKSKRIFALRGGASCPPFSWFRRRQWVGKDSEKPTRHSKKAARSRQARRESARERALLKEAAFLGVPQSELWKIARIQSPQIRKAFYKTLIQLQRKARFKPGQTIFMRMLSATRRTLRRARASCMGLFRYFGFRAAPSAGTVKDSSRKNGQFELTTPQCQLAYLMTAINPTLSVLLNEYVQLPRRLWPFRLRPRHVDPHDLYLPAKVYRSLFYFARLKPRLVFVIGAALRALQMTTALQMVFDPRIGVGAGLNLLAWSTNSAWPSALTLGWATSKCAWKALHAAPPPETVVFPIRLSVTRSHH